MPLNGAGLASKPSGTTAVANTTIESAKFNSVIDDIYAIFNLPRPIAYGGTGGATKLEAQQNLDLEPGVDVQPFSAALDALAAAFTKASASGPASLALAEDTDNGSNKVAIKAPAAITADRTLTLPDKDGTFATTDDIVTGGWTQIGTAIATTSGSAINITDIPAYRQLQIRLKGVSFTASATLTLALSTNNGSSHGTAKNIAGSTGSGAGTLTGYVLVDGIGDSGISKTFLPVFGVGGSYGLVGGGEDSAVTGVVNAIQLAGGTFDAGSITLWGIK